MRSFEIFVDQGSSAEHAPRGEASLAERRGGAPRGPAPREVLDIFIQGTNVTASVNERNAVSVLRDLASALTENGMADLGDLEDHHSLRG